VPEETLDIRSFLGSADPTFLVTDKLESNLQELISSEDACCIILIVMVSIFHGDVLMENSRIHWLLLMSLVVFYVRSSSNKT
jgi:hypothetical protein